MKKVAFISQPEYFRFIYENDLNHLFEVREFSFHFGMKPEEFQDLLDFNADYNIFFRGEFFPQEVLQEMKGLNIALSSEPFPRKIDNTWEYTLDSLKRYSTFRNIREKSFDYVFHYDVSSLPLFQKDGLNISGEFVFPVARDVYRPKEKEEKVWDIFFVGRSTDHREKFFGPLKHHFNFLHIAHGVWGPEVVDYMRKSKICINAHAENETSWEPRMQMMLATGAFVMSEKITPNKYIRPGIDFVEYATPRDLFEKVETYLKNEDERKVFSMRAQETIKKNFDSKKVFVEFLQKIDSGEFKKFSNNGGLFLFDALKIFQ